MGLKSEMEKFKVQNKGTILCHMTVHPEGVGVDTKIDATPEQLEAAITSLLKSLTNSNNEHINDAVNRIYMKYMIMHDRGEE